MNLDYFKKLSFQKTTKSFGQIIFWMIGIFLCLFVVFHIAGALYTHSLLSRASHVFQNGLKNDLAHLKREGDALAKSETLKDFLMAGDHKSLLDFLQTERAKRSIGLMGVADRDGVIIGRTKSFGKVGDNSFLISPIGRRVAQGQSAESIEAPIGFDPRQIFLTTGRPIFKGDKMIGGLFANYLTDDQYAISFRDKYLPAGVEVIFYNKEAGLYGSSFIDQKTKQLLESYFNIGTDWIKEGVSGKTVSFGESNFYLVGNIVFPGLEQSPGGALLFIPRYDISFNTSLTISLLTLGIFFALAVWHHLRSRGEERGWRYIIFISLTGLLVFALSFLALQFKNSGYFRLTHIPYTLYNSTLRLQPDFGVYDLNFEQTFLVVVDTGDEPINAVSFGLVFDPLAVRVISVEPIEESCSYTLEKVISQEDGTVDFSCVLLAQNGGRESLPIVKIITTPLRSGTFNLTFDELKTKVLANDGLGTDVLRMSQGGSYQAIPFEPTNKDGIVIFSPTHPNQSRWYNLSTTRLVFRGEGEVYAYSLDNNPLTIPSLAETVLGEEIVLPLPGDGVFYFHLKSIESDEVAHYRLQVDKTPPTIAALHLSDDQIVAGDVVRTSFEAYDIGSGVQRNYYIDLGNRLFLPVGSNIFIPFLEPGNQKITLRVYDDAGNYAEQSRIVRVEDKQ